MLFMMWSWGICIVISSFLSISVAEPCCPIYGQTACDHNDGNFFPATCCGDGNYYCQARGMMGSVCKFSSPAGHEGKSCGPWASPKCKVKNCVRFVIGKASNDTTPGKNYEGQISVSSSGAGQFGSTAVVFEWYKDNYLRNIFDGRCLSGVSGSRIDFVACNKASRWETQVSAIDNGRPTDTPVVIIHQLDPIKDVTTNNCIALKGTNLRYSKCADAAEMQWVLAPQDGFV